jgi:hypothetical protein
MDKLTIYEMDPDVPEETVIRFSRWKQAFYIFLALLTTGAGGLWVFFPKDDPGSFSSIWSYVLGTLFICFGGGFLWIAVRDFFNRDVQLVIGNRGIKRLGGELYLWEEIHEEKIVRKGSGRSTSFHLTYSCPRGVGDVTLSGLDIGRTRLGHLIHVYRKRSIAGKSSV